MKYVLLLILLCSSLMAEEKEVTKRKGYIDNSYLSTTTVTKGDTTRTKGYIDNTRGDGYIDLKTVETPSGTRTTGWVDGKYVRIKEKKKDEG